MNILGTGLVCARGRGADAVDDTEWRPPSFIEVPFQKELFPVYAVVPEILKDRSVLGAMRRADRFSKMAMLAAHDAVAAGGVELGNPERIGIVFATGFGPHTTTFSFLDDILDYGDAGVSPTIFSSSVHNAAVSYISRGLDIKGPTWTTTRFKDPFAEAIVLAQAWLDEGRCDRILVGAGDECGPVMEYIFSEKLPIATDGKIRKDAHVPGEGMAFFLVGNDGAGPKLRPGEEDYSSALGNLPAISALNCAMATLNETGGME